MWQKIKQLWHKNGANGALKDYLEFPLPDITQDYRDASYVVLDLETTGLDPAHDEIISIGLLRIENWRVQLSSTQHMLIKSTQSVANSAIYHGIVDEQLSHARTLSEIMPCILEVLKNRILVVHSASVDVAFLNAACEKLYQSSLIVYTVDTMALGMWRYQLEQRTIPEDGLRLHRLREKYHLPEYPAHHALSDAIATAELFMAMASHISGKQKMPVKRLLK